MPPETPGSVTVVDLSFQSDTLVGILERLQPADDAWLSVTWSSNELPVGYVPLGGGVIGVDGSKGLAAIVKSTGSPDMLGDLRYAWREPASLAGLMFVALLPPDYSLTVADPLPQAAKVFGPQQRIAVYWMLENADDMRAKVTWTLAPLAGDPVAEVGRLNSIFYDGGQRPAAGWVFLSEPPPATAPAPRTIRVFVSYSHMDRDYVDALLRYLAGLKGEGFDLWDDARLRTGELWDTDIRHHIEEADVALIVVSQDFLNSPYATEIEVGRLLERRREHGMKLFPVLLSPCDWESVEWLRQTQMTPRQGKTVKTHFRNDGERDALFLTILKELRAIQHEVGRRRLLGGVTGRKAKDSSPSIAARAGTSDIVAPSGTVTDTRSPLDQLRAMLNSGVSLKPLKAFLLRNREALFLPPGKVATAAVLPDFGIGTLKIDLAVFEPEDEFSNNPGLAVFHVFLDPCDGLDYAEPLQTAKDGLQQLVERTATDLNLIGNALKRREDYRMRDSWFSAFGRIYVGKRRSLKKRQLTQLQKANARNPLLNILTYDSLCAHRKGDGSRPF